MAEATVQDSFTEGNEECPPLTEWEAQKAIRRLFFHHDYVLPNVYMSYTEMDVCVITKRRQIWEVEIKLSLSDWANDEKKLKWKAPGEHAHGKVASFFYAVPSELLETVPAFVSEKTGLIRLFRGGGIWHARIVRGARHLSDYKMKREEIEKMLKCIHFRYWDVMERLDDARTLAKNRHRSDRANSLGGCEPGHLRGP